MSLPRDDELPDLILCECGNKIFDGDVLLARVTRLIGGHWYAKCRRCKRDVRVPLIAIRGRG